MIFHKICENLRNTINAILLCFGNEYNQFCYRVFTGSRKLMIIDLLSVSPELSMYTFAHYL